MNIGEVYRRIKQVFYSVGSASYSGGYYGGVLESFSGAWQRNIVCESRENLLAFSAVYACVGLISDDVAKLRIKLMQQSAAGVWTETQSAAFSPVLRKPNRYQTRIQFLSQWMVSKLLYGNTYVYKLRDARGVVTELYVLDPRKVVPQITDDGAVYYKLNEDYLNQVDLAAYVPASAIIHDRMLCLFHPLVGISPIYACGASATQGLRIQNASNKFFENQMRPSGGLFAPGPIDEPTALRLKERLTEGFSGNNIGKFLVAGDGMKYEPFAMTAVDAQLIEQQRWTVEDVARAFRVALHKLGMAAPINTSVVALNQDYYAQTLQTYIESIEVLLDEGLSLPTNYGTELDIDGLLRMDQVSLAEVLKVQVGAGIMSPDEARQKINLEPVTGGNIPYLQQQNYSLEALAKRDTSDDPFGTKPKPAPAPPQSVLPAPPAAGPKELCDALIAKFVEAARARV